MHSALVHSAVARVIFVLFLLARLQGFLLIGSHEALAFLHGLLANFPRLLLLLLRRERGVGADGFDFGAGLARDGSDLFHHGLLNARLLPARFLTAAARRTVL